MTKTQSLRRLVKPVAFVAAVAPLTGLAFRGVGGELGANPIEVITHETGIWALRFLLVTLAITPLRQLSGWRSLISLRRMLGLFAFFYASLHFGTYLVLDQFFDVASIVQDIAKRPYVTAGFAAFVLLVPLAVTSTTAMIRRLGGRRWRLLHRLVYASALGGVVHYLWLVKADTERPLTYGVILATLLGFRVWHAFSSHSTSAQRGIRALRPGVEPET
jgi:sulfoxide reductase heme-binding subunit YedZ